MNALENFKTHVYSAIKSRVRKLNCNLTLPNILKRLFFSVINQRALEDF